MEESLEYFFHHFFLPRRLPDKHDGSPERESAIVDLVRDSLIAFKSQDYEHNTACSSAIRSAISTLDGMYCATDSNGYLQDSGVRRVLRDITFKGIAVFHVKAQNAGLLIRKSNDLTIFEAFELSPASEAVIMTRGRLVRQFPATAIEIPSDVYNDGAFKDVLIDTLVTMSHQVAREMKAEAKKAKQFHVENQDTTDPHIVTELLTSMLRGIGKQVDVPGVCKNTHDEVMWKNSNLPWRRSPVWLLIRVSLQLTMSRVAADSGELYKRFMIFLLADVLKVANEQLAPSSVLHPMAMKISRRLLKLESPQGGKWLTAVQRIMAKTSNILDQRWEDIRVQSKKLINLAAVADLDMKNAINYTLPEVEQFLSSIQQPQTIPGSIPFHPTSSFQQLDAAQLPCVSKIINPETLPFGLAEIESWVATHLEVWLESHLGDELTCRNLSTLLEEYHEAGTEWYTGRPEGVSRMLLTTLELWVAADKAAVHAIPLLRNYDPEVPIEVFQALLLGLRRDMDRLYHAESYVMGRKTFAKSHRTPSVFRSYDHEDSFPVQYFSTSATHQASMEKIVKEATVQRQEKGLELQELKEQHEELMQEYDQAECETVEVERDGLNYSEHSGGCSRCKMLSKAKSLAINVHEWPLSEHTTKAQTTVFELDIPPVFCEWRRLTLYFIDNVLQCCEKGSDPPPGMLSLQSYLGLAKYAQWNDRSRICLMSDWAAHTSTHRVRKEVSFLSFGSPMLDHLKTGLERIGESWDSHIALGILTFLTARLLSMAAKDLEKACLDLLEQCRDVSAKWLRRLRTRLDTIPDGDQRIEVQQTIVDVALVCVDTFYVEDEFLKDILSQEQQAARLMEASIIIRNNSNVRKPTNQPLRNIMHDRWTYTLHRSQSILSDEILLRHSPCLTLAIQGRWPDFQSERLWTKVPSNRHWFETTAAGQKVHFNILSGELLVKGLPQSSLPRDYEEQEDYKKLFGCSVLHVMPSPRPGFDIRATKTFEGHTIHFGLKPSVDCSPRTLLLRLEKDGSSYDLVPQRFFAGLLPDSFTNNFVHWYHQTRQCIEFRPLNQPWRTSYSNWHLIRMDGCWVMRQGEAFLLSPLSPPGKCIASILSPLEAPLRLHIVYDLNRGTVEVKLPHLQLDFYLAAGKAEVFSRQFRGMQISDDQSTGTLIGLTSKLVLHKTNDPQNKTVIIPEGHVNYQKGSTDDHVKVEVAHGTACRVQMYHFDNQLHRLIDNHTMQSKLYLAYLHALTSYCLPDPFTHLTGTEQAISILDSAFIRSAGCLPETTMTLLQSIAALSPGRLYHPHHKPHTMQVVSWSSELSPLSQDGRFYVLARQILDNAHSMGFLYPNTFKEPPKLIIARTGLVERDVLRSSRQSVSGFGASDYTSKYDLAYSSKNRGRRPDRALRASDTSFRIFNGHQTLTHEVTPDLADHLYTLLTAEDGTAVDNTDPPQDWLKYDATWLQHPETFLSSRWCSLHLAFQKNQAWLNKFQLIAWLTTVSYAATNDEQVTQALLALALHPSVSTVPLPEVSSTYHLSQGNKFKSGELGSLIRKATRPLKQCPEDRMPRRDGESQADHSKRKRAEFLRKKNEAIKYLREWFIAKWPSLTLPQPSMPDTYVRVQQAISNVAPQWRIWVLNQQFQLYLERFVNSLRSLPVQEISICKVSQPTPQKPPHRPPGFVSVESLFSNPPPSLELPVSTLAEHMTTMVAVRRPANGELSTLLGSLTSRAKSDSENEYIANLKQSHSELEDQVSYTLKETSSSFCMAKALQDHHDQCDARAAKYYNLLLEATESSPRDLVRTIATQTKFWPRASPILFLQQLRKTSWSTLSESWRKSIVAYGNAITALQQAKRLLGCQDNKVDLLRELQNLENNRKNTFEHPEWLLLECESGIIIRDVQTQIAQEMINPPENKNSVMQLNMGEGKSSVIVPIVATTLGNGKQLVRVIVAKPQANQMHQMLLSKLAGLLDRPVYRFRFSRAISMDNDRANLISGWFSKCMAEGGVLLVQPEDLLSFQLMGLEYQIKKEHRVADRLLAIQQFLEGVTRDVIDESDENLSIKFELVYVVGQQQCIEHSPERWTVIQQVLNLFGEVAKAAIEEFPQSLEVEHREAGKFPRVRVLRLDAEQTILNRVATSICKTGLIGFPIARQPLYLRKAILRYITEPDVSPEDISKVEGSPFWNGAAMNSILLLRGLFSGGILGFAFSQKRWRVDYGTDPNREVETKLAVPFRAKDSPTPRSEFSHPDIVIVLTCLSYYYGGLEFDDIFAALELLNQSDNMDLEYRTWVETTPELPQAYRQLKGINLRDRIQCNLEIFPHLRYSKGAIDYFLSRMVFPKQCKEFPSKLSASGWDLGKAKNKPTTGFSGTNDSRYVLPLNICQLPNQEHTNALVLTHLLHPDNGIALVPSQNHQATMESGTLLAMVSRETRVILDVGAQVVDLNNFDFAQRWLKSYGDDEQTLAVIFFNEADELTVLNRCGGVEELQTSPFVHQLDQCLVFLDEAHTRGTDLKLPANYQAAVTLGANLTKDRLVQACMRMRTLGHGQTVVFCIPKEIEQKILMQNGWGPPAVPDITISDVLCWVISETWVDLRRAIPLWANQGLRFYEQKSIWDGYRPAKDDEKKEKWASRFLEDEAQSLDSRYRPRASKNDLASILQRVNSLKGVEIQHRCQKFGFVRLDKACLQEEQERELSPETERERQVELPPAVEARDHKVHPNLRRFIESGKLPSIKSGFKGAFSSLGDTSAAAYFDVNQLPCDIWVTDDFASTVEVPAGSGHKSDLFQRPVQWVLTNKPDMLGGCRLVIISPFEAQSCLHLIMESDNVTLHLYAPRTNLGFQRLDRLSLYTVPPRATNVQIPKHLTVYLNLFAGQLYISSFEEYVSICDILGLAWDPSDDSIALDPDGFIPQGLTEGRMINKSALTKSPVKFLKALMTNIRQNCETIEKTHMGKILDGMILQDDEFD
ncbi:hypothetical protein EDB81DRAFT_898494, partial [Dactylonectria macrodidyma]